MRREVQRKESERMGQGKEQEKIKIQRIEPRHALRLNLAEIESGLENPVLLRKKRGSIVNRLNNHRPPPPPPPRSPAPPAAPPPAVRSSSAFRAE